MRKEIKGILESTYLIQLYTRRAGQGLLLGRNRWGKIAERGGLRRTVSLCQQKVIETHLRLLG